MANQIACFGVPSIFSFKSKVCGNCDSFSECKKESYASLLQIGEYPIATSLLKQFRLYDDALQIDADGAKTLQITKPIAIHIKGRVTRYALTQKQLDRIDALPKKIGKFLEKIWVRGLDKQIQKDILAGKNPFDSNKARAYHKAYEVLEKGRVHRSKMSLELIDTLGWSYASAYSQVSMIWQIFPELNIAEKDGLFLKKISPNYSDNNTENFEETIYEY